MKFCLEQTVLFIRIWRRTLAILSTHVDFIYFYVICEYRIYVGVFEQKREE